MNLRQWVDNVTGLADNTPKVKPVFKQGDQVVVKRKMGNTRLATKELMAGTLLSFTEAGRSAVVSIPRPGGRQLRCTVPVSQLSAASEVYRRARVQINPAFRGSV
jgi:hypothetical protein